MERDDHEELIRLRERCEVMFALVLKNDLLIDDLREWRVQARLQLDGLVKAEEIAEAVSVRLEGDRSARVARSSFHLNVWQTRAAVGGFLLTTGVLLAGSVHQIVMWL